MGQEITVLQRDADKLGIDLTSAEYGYEVVATDEVETVEEALAVDAKGGGHE